RLAGDIRRIVRRREYNYCGLLFRSGIPAQHGPLKILRAEVLPNSLLLLGHATRPPRHSSRTSVGRTGCDTDYADTIFTQLPCQAGGNGIDAALASRIGNSDRKSAV